METDLWRLAQDLPSIKRFHDTVTKELIDGRNVIAMFPPGFDTDNVWTSISARLWEKNLYGEQRDVSSQEQVPTDAWGLARWLEGREFPTAPGDLADSLINSNLPDVVNLTGLSRLQDADRINWIESIHNWSEVSRARMPAGERWFRFLIMVPADTIRIRELPKTDVLLDIRWWWGFPSSLELRLLCRELDSGEDEIRTAWRECLISGIAPGDLMLADALWSEFPKTYQELSEQLTAYSNAFFPCASLSKGSSNVGRSPRVRDGDELPLVLYDDWEKGTIIGSHEFGVEPHPAALAKNGYHDQLEHRMWRGQAQFLMPLIDQVRLTTCSLLVKRLGNRWFDQFDHPTGLGELDRLHASPLDAEFGYLESLARREPLNFQKSGLQRTDILPAWRIRNKLSHYQAVTWDDFHDFYSQYGKN